MKKKTCVLFLLLMLCCLLPAMETGAASESEIQNQKTEYRNQLKKEDGKTYYYDGKGKPVRNRWKTVNGRRYYFKKNKAAATGPFAVGGVRFLFGRNGVLKTDGFYSYEGKTYYVNGKGKIQTGWQKIQGDQYYFNEKGVLQKSRWITAGGSTFYVDDQGILQKNKWIDGRYVGENGAYDPDQKDLMVLKTKMESAIRSFRGSWSVYVKNLETGQYFSINNRSMYAASLIKLYAMGAAYSRIAQGKISESSVSAVISSMITVSDNASFNTIVRKVGLTYINQWCRENGYTETNQGHGISLSGSGNYHVLDNGSGPNMTSAADCGKFLESVYRGTCVSADASRKMLGYLKRQQRRSKIPAGIPGGVVVANKTGETDNYTHDAAIVYSKNAPYILVVMGDTPGSGWISAKNITGLSRLTYNYLNP